MTSIEGKWSKRQDWEKMVDASFPKAYRDEIVTFIKELLLSQHTQDMNRVKEAIGEKHE